MIKDILFGKYQISVKFLTFGEKECMESEIGRARTIDKAKEKAFYMIEDGYMLGTFHHAEVEIRLGSEIVFKHNVRPQDLRGF